MKEYWLMPSGIVLVWDNKTLGVGDVSFGIYSVICKYKKVTVQQKLHTKKLCNKNFKGVESLQTFDVSTKWSLKNKKVLNKKFKAGGAL